MTEFPKGQVTSFDLSAEDQLDAEDIITGMQQCMLGLLNRKDSMIKQVSRARIYGPLTTTITIDNNVVIIEKGAGELKIKLNGNPVLKLTGLNLDMIDYQGMQDALRGIRKYTILDDLANV